jgi:hypothetical protein
MVEIGATQTQSAFVFDKSNPCFAAQLLSAIVTNRISIGNENFKFGFIFRSHTHLIDSRSCRSTDEFVSIPSAIEPPVQRALHAVPPVTLVITITMKGQKGGVSKARVSRICGG